jgi:hypothetical protein
MYTLSRMNVNMARPMGNYNCPELWTAFELHFELEILTLDAKGKTLELIGIKMFKDRSVTWWSWESPS